jgi:hypothetical protein
VESRGEPVRRNGRACAGKRGEWRDIWHVLSNLREPEVRIAGALDLILDPRVECRLQSLVSALLDVIQVAHLYPPIIFTSILSRPCQPSRSDTWQKATLKFSFAKTSRGVEQPVHWQSRNGGSHQPWFERAIGRWHDARMDNTW